MNYLEMIGTAVGLVYLWLEYKASAWLWVAGVIMPVIYLKVYYDAGLYADLGISIYYIIASVYGLACWLVGSKQSADEGRISYMPKGVYAPLAGVFAVVFVVIGLLLSRLTDSTVPWADAFTTALSIVAMWMLAKKYVEQWIAWIAADVACSVLYVYKELWFTSGLYLAYAVIAVLGYMKWKRMITHND